jgi:exosortase/archaeosortase family protein
LLALALTLIATVADEFAAPILYSTTPFWGTGACLLLVWRHGKSPLLSANTPRAHSLGRLAAFVAAHLLLVFLARAMTTALEPMAGMATVGGALVGAWKMSILAPTLLLLPLPIWKGLVSAYRSEIRAAVVVLLAASVPGRVMEALWPWYGQVLGRLVYALARPFVPGLGYDNALYPSLTGADLDVTILLGCSGIKGFELFSYLFGIVMLVDWNRLRKDRALIAYFFGVFAVLLGNALRITSFVIVSNRGNVDFIPQFHVYAGWIFFSLTFLVYLSLTYAWMLDKKSATAER